MNKMKFKIGVALLIIPIVLLAVLQALGKGAINPISPIWILHLDIGATAVDVSGSTPPRSFHRNLQLDLAIILPACVFFILGLVLCNLARNKADQENP